MAVLVVMIIIGEIREAVQDLLIQAGMEIEAKGLPIQAGMVTEGIDLLIKVEIIIEMAGLIFKAEIIIEMINLISKIRIITKVIDLAIKIGIIADLKNHLIIRRREMGISSILMEDLWDDLTKIIQEKIMIEY